MEHKLEKLEKKQPYKEEIKSMIMDAITKGIVKPGERIVETRWAKELGVSQSPIREALRELEMTGLVETIPYKGCVVREITRKEIINSLRVRSSLEILAVEQIFENQDFSFLEGMEEMMKCMRRCAESDAISAFLRKDSEFHSRLVNASENESLTRIWNQCCVHNHTQLTAILTYRPLQELAERHQLILDAFRDGDMEQRKTRAIQAIQKHFTDLIEEIEGAPDQKTEP